MDTPFHETVSFPKRWSLLDRKRDYIFTEIHVIDLLQKNASKHSIFKTSFFVYDVTVF